MDNETTENTDPDGAKLKAWLLTKRDGTRSNLKDEAVQMAQGMLTDWVHQFWFALRVSLIGGILGCLASYFLSFPLFLGAGLGALLLGLLAFLSWVPGSRF